MDGGQDRRTGRGTRTTSREDRPEPRNARAMKLGRVPAEFKTWHSCKRCKEFGPLFDLAYARLCPACVEALGGIQVAAETCRTEWKQEAAERRAQSIAKVEKPTPKVDTVDPPRPREARLWSKAQSLHKAMRCTPEEAYDRLVEAEAARERHNQCASPAPSAS